VFLFCLTPAFAEDVVAVGGVLPKQFEEGEPYQLNDGETKAMQAATLETLNDPDSAKFRPAQRPSSRTALS